MSQTKTLLRVFAVAMDLGGTALIAWGVTNNANTATWTHGWTVPVGVALILVGVSLWWVARFVGGLQGASAAGPNGFGGFGGMVQQAMATYGPSSVEATGRDLIGNAQIIAIRDTGVTISDVNAVFEIRCLVTVTGRTPYEALTRVALGRAQWGFLQPGMTVPVRVDPDAPSKVALDPSRPVVPAGAGSFAGGVAGASPTFSISGGGAAKVTTIKAADIVAAGVRVTGVLQQVAPTGMTAGQVAGRLAPEEANDPVVHAIFVYSDGAGSSHRCESLFRVPDGKAHYLVPGHPIPVSFLADNPARATIDFSRLA